MQVRTARQFEVLFAAPGTTWAPRADPRLETFDAMYDDGPDPWQHEQSPYEARRREIVLAVCGRRHHRAILEIGSATGLFTAQLQPRADRVVAVEASGRALEVARARDLDGVTWVQGTAPDALADLPEAGFDLVVLSEVGYFLRPAELLATARQVRRLLAPEGEVVAAHWTHPTRDIPSDGALVHAQFAATLGLPVKARYADADMRVEVWGEGPSAAAREGLV